MNERIYYESREGLIPHYVNCRTGETKYSLDEEDILIERHLDDLGGAYGFD